MNDWQKLLVEMHYFQGSLKKNNTQTLPAGIRGNFGFKQRMTIWQYWSFEDESLNFIKVPFLFLIPPKLSFLTS